MLRVVILILFCCFNGLYAQEDTSNPPPPPPAKKKPPIPPRKVGLKPLPVIEAELSDAQREFEIARSMFNPWYTGPLLTPSAHVLQPGHLNLQPYIFFTTNYGVYNERGSVVDTPDLFVINPSLSPAQIGLTKWMDIAVSVQVIYQRLQGVSYANFGDSSVTLGFGVMSETVSRPAVKFAVRETFPSGNYQEFSVRTAGVESTGGGAFVTTPSVNISKVVWWSIKHPMNIRTSLNFSFPSDVHVKGINSYGGDIGTRGTVSGGNNFAGNLGYEVSITQKWVFAIDGVYTYTWDRTFHGHTTAPVGGPFNDQLSFAPAIEYNLSANGGFIGGVWFSVWGRNSSAFHSEIISFTWVF